jgi:hypothetical protein
MSNIYQASTLTVTSGQLPAIDAIQNSFYGVTFGSTTVTLSEAQAIAQAASLYLATGKVNYTSPSGITVIGSNGSVSVAGTALTFDQLASMALSISHYVVSGVYWCGPYLTYTNTTT